ncbi:hypothetical protein C1646_772173 [Rhizophagus diaphanus]|nr:hypothetical protein C1646_772173 [Rhizophagus diaphanus] [Rhizophagus sp. MUCL 43196]
MSHCYFQRQRKSNITNDSSNSLENNKSNDDCIILNESNNNTKHEFELKVETSSLDDILANIHQYVEKLTDDKEIMHSDYSISFKPEKSEGVEAQLKDIQNYKKFLSDYKRLANKKKNMSIIVSLKKKKQKRKEISDFEESESGNIKLHKKKNAVPKLKNFSTILQQKSYIIYKLKEKYKCNQHDASYFIGDERYIKFTAMHLQCWAKEIIQITVDRLSVDYNTTSNIPLFSPKQAVPSLDEFFTKLGANGDTEELIDFKNIFENERITVDQIHDLTDAEFDQLGVNKIGWRKAFRIAAKCYK